MPKNIAYILVLITAFFWGSMAGVGKLLLARLDNLQVLFFASVFSFVTLLIISIFQNKITVIKKYAKKDYLILSGMGFLGGFLNLFFFYAALRSLPAQEAFIINYLWPVLVVVFAVPILKERLTLRKIVGIALSFCGVALVISKGDLFALRFNNAEGMLLALASAVTYGLFSVLGKKQDYDKLASTTLIAFFTLIYFAIAILFFSKIPSLNLSQLFGLLWIGSLANGVAFLFWFLALKYGDTSKVSNMILLTPFISLVYIYFLTGEKIMFSSIIGLAVIVGGILVQSASKRTHNKTPGRGG
jgi:drug/metabolite transporter (DMT)-like permease